ncbi:MAG: hypothetical protein ACI9C2_002250 [Gammaproteobacteria bacterium]|jgi:hypothetical protein
MRISLSFIVLTSLGVLAVRPLFHSPAVRAGTALRMDTNELVESAALVIEGRVLSVKGVETKDGMIETEYELLVERTFEGVDLVERTVRIPGGLLADGRGLLLAGLPRLGVGEETLLFLSETSASGVRMPVGLSQGRYRIVRNLDGSRVAVRDQGELGLIDPQTGEVIEAAGRHVRNYAELISEIEAAVAREQSLGPRSGASSILEGE